jgi:hypothetical protein
VPHRTPFLDPSQLRVAVFALYRGEPRRVLVLSLTLCCGGCWLLLLLWR